MTRLAVADVDVQSECWRDAVASRHCDRHRWRCACVTLVRHGRWDDGCAGADGHTKRDDKPPLATRCR